ncbi:hypothetical protein FRC03_006970 [Tulasnella sp. 419]|nr:hypothetical protein FRC03_006970 [Tulasnella sp. 419]
MSGRSSSFTIRIDRGTPTPPAMNTITHSRSTSTARLHNERPTASSRDITNFYYMSGIGAVFSSPRLHRFGDANVANLGRNSESDEVSFFTLFFHHNLLSPPRILTLRS